AQKGTCAKRAAAAASGFICFTGQPGFTVQGGQGAAVCKARRQCAQVCVCAARMLLYALFYSVSAVRFCLRMKKGKRLYQEWYIWYIQRQKPRHGFKYGCYFCGCVCSKALQKCCMARVKAGLSGRQNGQAALAAYGWRMALRSWRRRYKRGMLARFVSCQYARLLQSMYVLQR
ncbi:hypothetical protein NPIL_636361, partial [Nephila pilipes]